MLLMLDDKIVNVSEFRRFSQHRCGMENFETLDKKLLKTYSVNLRN